MFVCRGAWLLPTLHALSGGIYGREIGKEHGCFYFILIICVYVEEHGFAHITHLVTGNLGETD